MLSSVLYLLFTSTSVEAHSWIQCTDYRGDTDYYQGNQCFGHVRPWQRGQNDIVSPNQSGFGVDQGFNKRLDETPDGECNSLIDNQGAAGNFPMANYKRGQTITLAWPAKNHVADTCANNPGGANIPDAFNGLYMEKSVPGLRITYNREVVFEPMTAGNTHVQGQIDYKGYQKCPKFCEDRDKALCTGTFVVPDVPDGKYSFSWRWEFNAGRSPPETYVTCFEAMVQGDDITPITGAKWDEGGVGMFVERGQGCNNHMTEDKCLSYADGRSDRVGERCAWCCGENCNEQGGPGGDNKCEPVAFLDQHGIDRYRTADADMCNPTTSDDTQLMAPNGRMGRMNCAPLMGQCGGEGAMANCCMEGECVPVTPFLSQCQPSSKSEEGGVSMTMVLLAVGATFIAALCCGSVLVYMKMNNDAGSSDAYRKHNSLSDRDTRSRHSDRHERARRKKKKSRARDDSRERSRSRKKDRRTRDTRRDSLSPKRTSSNGSWVEDN